MWRVESKRDKGPLDGGRAVAAMELSISQLPLVPEPEGVDAPSGGYVGHRVTPGNHNDNWLGPGDACVFIVNEFLNKHHFHHPLCWQWEVG